MRRNSVKRNFAYQVAYQILSFILPFITSPYIARVIGAEGLGIYSYSYTIAYYFTLFAMLGLSNYGIREIARCKDSENNLNKTFSEIEFVHIALSCIVLLAYIVYVILIKQDQLYALIQVIYVISILLSINWFYFGIENFKFTVTVSMILKITNVIAILVFVRNEADLWKYCLIMSLGALIEQVILWIPLHKYVAFEKVPIKCILKHIKPLLLLFIPVIAVSLYKYMDKIMIGAMSSKTELGIYENAEKMINMPMAIIVSFGTVMLPKMSSIASTGSKDDVSHYIDLSMRYIMCLAFALAFGLSGIANVFAPWFWGVEFTKSAVIMMGLSITIPFISFANIIRTQYLIPTKKDKEYLSSVIVGAIINLLINCTLIPKLGSIGAMIGTIAAEIAVCFVQAFVVRRDLQVNSYILKSTPYILYGAIMFFAVYIVGVVFKTGFVTLIVQLTVGILMYGGFTALYFRYIGDDIIKRILHKITHK